MTIRIVIKTSTILSSCDHGRCHEDSSAADDDDDNDDMMVMMMMWRRRRRRRTMVTIAWFESVVVSVDFPEKAAVPCDARVKPHRPQSSAKMPTPPRSRLRSSAPRWQTAGRSASPSSVCLCTRTATRLSAAQWSRRPEGQSSGTAWRKAPSEYSYSSFIVCLVAPFNTFSVAPLP